MPAYPPAPAPRKVASLFEHRPRFAEVDPQEHGLADVIAAGAVSLIRRPRWRGHCRLRRIEHGDAAILDHDGQSGTAVPAQRENLPTAEETIEVMDRNGDASLYPREPVPAEPQPATTIASEAARPLSPLDRQRRAPATVVEHANLVGVRHIDAACALHDVLVPGIRPRSTHPRDFVETRRRLAIARPEEFHAVVAVEEPRLPLRGNYANAESEARFGRQAREHHGPATLAKAPEPPVVNCPKSSIGRQEGAVRSKCRRLLTVRSAMSPRALGGHQEVSPLVAPALGHVAKDGEEFAVGARMNGELRLLLRPGHLGEVHG